MSRQSTGRLAGKVRCGLALLAVALVGSACGSTPSREDTLILTADEVIVPAYDALLADVERLHTATLGLCEAPDLTRLAAARAALAEARSSWSFSEVMWVGPVTERRSWAVIDWPINEAQIEMLLADDEGLDQERLAKRIGADQRGLGAVEYILGGGDEGSTDEVAQLDERRCEYLTNTSAVIADEARLLVEDWSTSWEGGEPYRSQFGAAENNGLDTVVNDSLFLLEAMVDAELGTALGLMDGPADVESIQEGPAGLGSADLAAHVAGLRAVLFGAQAGGGVADLLSEDLSGRLEGQLDVVDVALGQRALPLRLEASESPDRLTALRSALKELQIIVATEVVAALGVTIGFSDADGDTG